MSDSNIGDKILENIDNEADDCKTEKEMPSAEDLGGNEEREAPMPCRSSNEFNTEPLFETESSSASRATLNMEMTLLHKADEEVDKHIETENAMKTNKEQSSDVDLCGYIDSQKPRPCVSSDESYAERFPIPASSSASGVTLNIDMTYLHKDEAMVEKYLEIVDDVMINKGKSSDEVKHESGPKEPCTTSDWSNAERSLAPERCSNTRIEMTYLHKKDEEKVGKYRYMSLDQDRKRREDTCRYEAPCTSHSVHEWLPTSASSHSPVLTGAENLLNTDEEYDEVKTESENSSDTSPGSYEEPHEAHSGQPPVPGGSRSPVAAPGEISTPGETAVYQELQ